LCSRILGVILKGKKILIAGLSDRRSIGYAIAVEAQKEGAELILTSFGRMMSITQMTAKKLSPVPEIFEMDVQKPSDIKAAVKAIGERWDRIDGIVHSVAYAPPDALGGNFLNTPWESVATALQVIIGPPASWRHRRGPLGRRGHWQCG